MLTTSSVLRNMKIIDMSKMQMESEGGIVKLFRINNDGSLEPLPDITFDDSEASLGPNKER